MLIVQKYGGSSLADEQKILNAARRAAELTRQGHRVVLVVSAQADTTDELVAKAKAVYPGAAGRELDACMAAGEQLSASLMAMALESLGCSAVSLTGWQAGLRTDGVFGNARILSLDHGRIQAELEKGRTVVVAGFQGVDGDGNITTLGRGGSDTTAVALAAFLQAGRCQIFTDVDGVYDRDPRRDPAARKYQRISYGDMLAMAQNGAQVLHDRCVEFAREWGVTVEVLSSLTGAPGTLVTDAAD